MACGETDSAWQTCDRARESPNKAIHDVPSVVAALRNKIGELEENHRVGHQAFFSSGHEALDRLLPGGGFARGTLIEWFSGERAHGAGTLALVAAGRAMAQGGLCVVVDGENRFYPPAAAALGIDLRRTVILRSKCLASQRWAIEQALRSEAVAALWARIETLDHRWFRRWQLAAERGGTVGMLIRPASARGQPSWARVQLWVEPKTCRWGRRWQVTVAGTHAAAKGGRVEWALGEEEASFESVAMEKLKEGQRLDVSAKEARSRSVSLVARNGHETRPLSLASQLAHPTPRRRSARA